MKQSDSKVSFTTWWLYLSSWSLEPFSLENWGDEEPPDSSVPLVLVEDKDEAQMREGIWMILCILNGDTFQPCWENWHSYIHHLSVRGLENYLKWFQRKGSLSLYHIVVKLSWWASFMLTVSFKLFIVYLFTYLFIFAVGIKLRVSCILSECSITEPWTYAQQSPDIWRKFPTRHR